MYLYGGSVLGWVAIPNTLNVFTCSSLSKIQSVNQGHFDPLSVPEMFCPIN